ncbi:MAG: long-chain fatty acid--CoA ligase [Sphingomonadales bacterium]|nr:MAG: long-chain fatty acid--CoA ligase [Sphingomonadales bacterium]
MGEIVSGDRSITLQDVEEQAARAATGFLSIGLRAGDVIALYLRNDFTFFEASFAAGLIGAYPTPVNWHYAPPEADYLFRDCDAKAIVIHADLISGIADVLPPGVPVFVVETPPEIAEAYGIAAERCRIPPGMTGWSSWLAGFDGYDGPALTAPGTIIYTSGTTGNPKGVKRPLPDPAERAAMVGALCDAYGFSKAQKAGTPITTVVTGPMYHTAPNFYGLTAARAGARVILQPRFDTEDLLRLVEQERVTHLHMVPVMFHRLLKLPKEVRTRYDLSSLETAVHGTAPCPPPVKRAMIEWWGPIIDEYYGSTEVGLVTFCDSKEWLAHPGTVGHVVDHAEVRIMRGKSQTLPAGEIGEVVARLRTMGEFTYQGADGKRAAVDRDGLIATGDIGYFDADGFLYICDRSIDMIISGGVNIYPAEIEAELGEMPGVSDCAIFGIPSEEYGEQVYAVVEPEPGRTLSPEDVRGYLLGRMASFKVPRQVEFRTGLPREDSGKIFKRKLREPFWQGVERRI